MTPTLSQVAPVIAPAPALLDPEALIREARRRQHRRRLLAAGALTAVIAVAGLAYVLVRVSAGELQAIEHEPNGPTVNVRAFAHHGTLAFVSHNNLWLLDGSAGALRKLQSPPGFVPQQPIFSPDGKWLAYLEQHRTATAMSSYLWLAKADGSDAHRVSAFQTYTLVGWSPTTSGTSTDLLALAASGPSPKRGCPCASPTTLRLVTPSGGSRVLARANWIYGGAWAPNGRSVAVGEIDPHRSSLVVQPVSGGRPTVWLSRRNDQRLNGMAGVLVDVAGWWRGVGIGFWAFGNGAIHNNDETDLNLITSLGTKRVVLAPTLSDGTTTEFAANGRGLVAVVADVSNRNNGGRDFSDAKQVQLCAATVRCQSLVPRRSKVTVDPAWSADGRTLAFVEAPDYVDGWPLLHRWYAQHELLLYSTATKRIRVVPAAKGAAVPTWSRDGQAVLYEAHNALWLLPLNGSKPARIVRPLFSNGHWPSYYDQVAWSAQFAWNSPS